MKQLDHLNDLKEIRSLMEKSSRFISLSGLSGIFAGIFALAGAVAAYFYLELRMYRADTGFSPLTNFYIFFFADAGAVLLCALSSGIYFTVRQAKKKGQSIWDKTSKRMIINIAIPLIAGGIFCLLLLFHKASGLVASATLIFYGLAILNGSKFTLDDIRYLAYIEIILGLAAGFYPGFGLHFWAVGFGVMHIVYGTYMYFKYER
jgi:hypothetical protein